MDKKNYQKPSMKVHEMKMAHLICDSDWSTHIPNLNASDDRLVAETGIRV